MFAAALLFGLPLWLGYKVSPAWFPPIAAAGSWMHVKLLLVAVIFAFYITTGRMLKASAVRGSLPSGGVSLRFVIASKAKQSSARVNRSEEHTSELQSLMRISYAVFCLQK